MTVEIRRASEQDIPVLCEIWQKCFSDSEEYVRYFYSENFEHIEVLILFADGEPVSIGHMIDAEIVNSSKCQKAKYMYAGCTLPEHRKKGYIGEMINYIKNYAEENGYALFFKPVTQSLVAYYTKLGFQTDSYYRVLTLPAGQKVPLKACDISYKEYNRMRNEHFSSVPYVRWQDEQLRWCALENEFFSGKMLKTELDGKEHFLMGYPEEETLIINETDLTVNQLKKLSGALCGLFKTKQIKAYLPETAKEGEKIISTLVYNTPLNKTYANLILI